MKQALENTIAKWMLIAFTELGQSEIRGATHNDRIIEYHSVTTLEAKEDEVPWCSSFVSWCLEKSGISSTKSAWARSYLSYGKEVTDPTYGTICVFSRGENSGHVGFYFDEDDTHIHLLGGNQKDKVSLTRYPKSRLLAYREPILNM